MLTKFGTSSYEGKEGEREACIVFQYSPPRFSPKREVVLPLFSLSSHSYPSSSTATVRAARSLSAFLLNFVSIKRSFSISKAFKSRNRRERERCLFDYGHGSLAQKSPVTHNSVCDLRQEAREVFKGRDIMCSSTTEGICASRVQRKSR